LRRAEPVSAPRVHRVEHAHDQGFFPPVGAMYSVDGTRRTAGGRFRRTDRHA
jgi:hypothetical protein